MCTDNRPSDTSIAMGDVLTVYGGKTVEVKNTDAEGRLVMADALVLATEDETDAIVDIATLTGAAMRALGTQVAGLIGNNAGLVAQVEAAADVTGESVWELPLERRYRGDLDSDIADIKNLGGANAGRHHRCPVPRRVRRGQAVGPHRHRRHCPERPGHIVAPAGLHRVRSPAPRRARARTSNGRQPERNSTEWTPQQSRRRGRSRSACSMG